MLVGGGHAVGERVISEIDCAWHLSSPGPFWPPLVRMRSARFKRRARSHRRAGHYQTRPWGSCTGATKIRTAATIDARISRCRTEHFSIGRRRNIPRSRRNQFPCDDNKWKHQDPMASRKSEKPRQGAPGGGRSEPTCWGCATGPVFHPRRQPRPGRVLPKADRFACRSTLCRRPSGPTLFASSSQGRGYTTTSSPCATCRSNSTSRCGDCPAFMCSPACCTGHATAAPERCLPTATTTLA
jgi:hypothetical protein